MSRRLWALVGLTAALVVGGAVALWAYVNSAADRAGLGAQMARAKRAGLPMTAAELVPDAKVPDDQNAAVEARLAMGALEEIGPDLARLLSEYRPESEPEKAAWARLQAPLDGLVVGSSKPKLRFARDWDLGPAVPFRELAPLKRLAGMLAVRAELRAAEDPEGSMRDVLAVRNLGRLLAQTPTVIGLQVATNTDQMALDAFGRCFETMVRAGKVEQARALAAAFEQAEWPVDVRHALKGEWYLPLATLRNIEQFGGWSKVTTDPAGIRPDSLQRDGLPAGGAERRMLLSLAKTYTEVFEEGKGDPVATARVLTRHSKAAEATASPALSSSLFVPAAGSVDPGIRSLLARRLVSRGMVRMALGKLDQGGWPDPRLLGDLRDPFADGPVRWVVRGERVAVYSVGMNGKDENAALPESEVRFDLGDIAASWPSAPRGRPMEKLMPAEMARMFSPDAPSWARPPSE